MIEAFRTLAAVFLILLLIGGWFVKVKRAGS